MICDFRTSQGDLHHVIHVNILDVKIHRHAWLKHYLCIFPISCIFTFPWSYSSIGFKNIVPLKCLTGHCHWTSKTLHTTLYGSAAGCSRSIQKTCAFWKNGLTFENTQSQLTYFCKSNINHTFTNGNGMIWGVMIAIFTEIRHLVW